jgi:hypothetical protein
MPNFDAVFTASGSRQVWSDPATLTKPSRLNNDERRPHTYRRTIVGVPATVSAIVDGVVGPLDAALGGDLFEAWFGEYPTAGPPPALSSPGGQSSVVTFTAAHEGHHLLVLSRTDGGRLLVPFITIDV